jgi:hypothetical protein
MPVPGGDLIVEKKKTWRPLTAIPEALKDWGRVPDFDVWHPGDLILTRDKNPDAISKAIQRIQEPGYGSKHAQWTHSAIYLGDGLMLCEAQLDPAQSIFSVIVARCWNYFGTHDLLVRRSVWAPDKQAGWAIATAAATKIGGVYDWKFILKLAADRVLVGRDVLVRDHSGKISANAYVCSSLYSTAHAYVTDVTITDKTNGLCIPAFLAADRRHLKTIEFDWCEIDLE